MKLDAEDLAAVVVGVLSKATVGTVVTVRPNGAIETDLPGTPLPAHRRREPSIATFVAGRHGPVEFDVLERIKLGLRKVDPSDDRVA